MKQRGDGTVEVGYKSDVSETSQVIFSAPGTLRIGRYVSIGDGVKIIHSGGDVEIGDWTTIHADSVLMSEAGLRIGRHCWFGQNSILDGTGGLEIEDGVRVGMYSQIWSHVAAGEQIEGCTLFAKNRTVIERDVWLVGSCTVSSGIVIGERAVCMNGSNITKSIPAHATAMGIPAKVREGLSFYEEKTLDWKFDKLVEWSNEFAAIKDCEASRHENVLTIGKGQDKIIVLKSETDFSDHLASEPADVGVFCVETKAYRAAFSGLEETFIRWLASNKARFYPVN